MSTRFARPALALALTAMLVRALLPAGWMPNAAGPAHAFFTICTMEGPQRVTIPGADKPAPDRHTRDRANAPCAFASAAPFAPLVQSPIFATPAATAQFVGTRSTTVIRAQDHNAAHAARAPPFPA